MVIKISLYPVSNKSSVMYLFAKSHVDAKKKNQIKKTSQRASAFRTKRIWKNAFVGVKEKAEASPQHSHRRVQIFMDLKLSFFHHIAQFPRVISNPPIES